MELRSYDIDAKLLEQFSALGTTDKDELINNLILILGSEISRESSYFFLELAGWNLQRAVGAYFDFSFENSPSVFTNAASSSCPNSFNDPKDFTLSSFNIRIRPLNFTEFSVETLRIRVENYGISAWPEGIYLRSESDCTVAQNATQSIDTGRALWLPISEENSIPIHHILPSKSLDLNVNLSPPSNVYHMNGPIVGALSFVLPDGQRFGEILYCTAMINVYSGTWCYQHGVITNNELKVQNDSMLVEEN